MSKLKHTDKWPIVESMILADIGSKFELAIRYLVVFLGGFFITLEIEHYLVALWLGAFLVVNGAYSVWLSRIDAPVSRLKYFCLCVMLMTSVMLYASCAVFLFLHDSVAFKTIAVAAIVALAMFNLSRHRVASFLAIFDTTVVASIGLYFGLSAIYSGTLSTEERANVIVCTTGVCAYYVIAQYRNIETHRKLQLARSTAVQAQKMKSVGQITAGVSHDFNNILTVIRGNIELAELSKNYTERSDRLEDAKEAVDRAATVTSQLLSFSRKARLEASLVSLEEFWREFDTYLKRSVPANISTSVCFDRELKYLYCDKIQLENALLNLVVNARDALGKTGKINLRSRFATNREIRKLGKARRLKGQFGTIEVRDNGPGIDEQLLSSVTEPFFTTKPTGKGSGLGLSMVKGFTEQSGGGLVIDTGFAGANVAMILPTTQPA
ncbi:MAG: ATP-binding protein [Cyanobacteria bacterium P01_F01_bin.3]